MKKETIKSLKEEIGYTEDERGCCQKCANYIETDGVIDRTWDGWCALFEDQLDRFKVNPHGICERYYKK